MRLFRRQPSWDHVMFGLPDRSEQAYPRQKASWSAASAEGGVGLVFEIKPGSLRLDDCVDTDLDAEEQRTETMTHVAIWDASQPKRWRGLKVYIDTADHWIGHYGGPNHHYVCILPTIVIRWEKEELMPESDHRAHPHPEKETLANVGPGGNLDLENVFTYHAPFGDQVGRFEEIRSYGQDLAVAIAIDCPPSPERSTALAKVREAVMWANAAIACNEKPPADV